jgi:hypothetical protein
VVEALEKGSGVRFAALNAMLSARHPVRSAAAQRLRLPAKTLENDSQRERGHRSMNEVHGRIQIRISVLSSAVVTE